MLKISPSNNLSRWSRVVAVAAAAALVMASPSGAFAMSNSLFPPAENSTVNHELSPTNTANQMRLGELTSWILGQPGVESSGYIAQVNDADNLRVRLLWFGHDALQDASLNQAAKLGIAASVEQRPYSLQQIDEASTDLLNASDEFLANGFDIQSVAGVSIDSGSLVVSGTNVTTDARRGGDVEAETAAVADLAASITDVPVAIQIGSTVSAAGTRGNATLPLYAGARIVSSANGSSVTCSSGFSVNYGGSARSTTARHCVPPSGSWRSPSALTPTNFGNPLVTSVDGALTVISGSGAPRTFDNEWNNSSGFSKNVYNAYDVGLGDKVCTSGAVSGVRCNVQVTNMRVWFDDGYGNVATIEGTQLTAGKSAVARGDSGGPVFMPYGGSFAQSVGAVGMNQAGVEGAAVSCSDQSDPSSPCFQKVLFTSINTVINHGGLPGLYLTTGPN